MLTLRNCPKASDEQNMEIVDFYIDFSIKKNAFNYMSVKRFQYTLITCCFRLSFAMYLPQLYIEYNLDIL